MDENTMNPNAAPSTASRPDLDWSQVRETILMLNLATAQIEMAMRDSNGSVDVLTNTFTSMYGNLMALVEQVHTLPDSPVRQSIEAAGAAISGQMQHAIMAFQFYDRLSQRLSHVCRSLEDLSGIVSDPAQLYNPFAWHALQQKIRAKYTMEDEKLMFDKLLQTGDVRAALEQFVHAKQDQSQGGADVELF
ncbi:MAG: hypothetical protein AB1831_15380 [Pseudomonadota bacterium]